MATRRCAEQRDIQTRDTHGGGGGFASVFCLWSLSRRAESPQRGSVLFLPYSERLQPTQGHSAAAFWSHCKEISQIHEMNTCAGDEPRRRFRTRNLDLHAKTHNAFSVLGAQQTLSFVELTQFDTYQKLFFS